MWNIFIFWIKIMLLISLWVFFVDCIELVIFGEILL